MNRAELAAGLEAFPRREQPLSGRRAASVAVVVLQAGTEPGVVVTKRSSRLRTHAGQWALPGGRADPGETAEDAARRELYEELGLPVERSAVLGLLDDYATRSGYRITPVVVWAAVTEAELAPNPDEVASAHVVPMSELDVEPRFTAIPQSPAPVIQLPLLGTHIHAPTAAVLYQFREVALHGRATRVDHLEQPVFAWQ